MAANPTLQHTVNAVVASAPVVSFWARFPEIVTVVVGCLAAVYYTMVIAEKTAGWLAQWRQIKASSRSVTERIRDEATSQHPPEFYHDTTDRTGG